MSESNQELGRPKNTELSRRDLFRTAGMAAGGALLLGLPKFLSGGASEAEAALAPRPLGSTNVALELDGQYACSVRSAAGGNAFAELVMENLGPEYIQRKRPGQVRFEDILIEIPLGEESKLLGSWVEDFLNKSATPRNGAITYADFNLNEFKRLEFSNAVLTEVALPAADATEGKSAALLTLRITPQSTRLAGSSGKKAQGALGTKQKAVVSGNFRFNVQGLENACARISKVQGIAAKRAKTVETVGQPRLRENTLGILDCSLVSIFLPETDAGPFYTWFDETILKGKANGERGGLLEWLDPTLKNVLASAQLGGLGILRFAPEPVKAGGDKISLVQVDMYCETINLTL